MFRSNSSNSRARAAINASIYSDSMIQKYIEDIATFPDLQAQVDVLTIKAGNIYISPDVSNGIIDLNQQVNDLQIHDASNAANVQAMLATTSIIEASLNILLEDAMNPYNFSKSVSQTITGNYVFSGNVRLSQLNTIGLLYNDANGNLISKTLLVDADIAENASITDDKLATIQTAGKVLPSATTANVLPLPNTIVLRDASGDILALTLPNDVSDNRVANTAFVQNIIAQLVDSAPETLNTLNELSNAMGGDASFSQTIYGELAKKAPITDPTFGANVFATRLSVRDYVGTEGIVKVDASGLWTSGKLTQTDLCGVILTNSQLATITTAGKVANSATTATTDSSANTIMLRGLSGEWVNPRVNGFLYDPLPKKTFFRNMQNAFFLDNLTTTVDRPYSNDSAPIITRSQSEKALSGWRFSSTSVKNVAYRNIIEFQGAFYVIHSNGIVSSSNGGVNGSANTWTAGSPSPHGIAVGAANRFIIVGDNMIRTSTNLSTYDTTIISPSNTVWRNVVFSDELMTAVAVGFGTAMYSTTSPYTVWNLSSPVPVGDWTTLCWSSDLGRFVAVGSSCAMYSTDGISWTASTNVPDGSWNSIAWSPELGLYCAVAPTGTYRIMVSPDGIQWYGQSVPEMNAWQSICWAPEMGMFCAVSNDGTNRLMRSFDGIRWKSYSIPLNTWRCISWSSIHSVFYILHTSATGEMLISPLNARIPTADTLYLPNPGYSSMSSDGRSWTFQSLSITASNLLNSPNFSGNWVATIISNTVNPINTDTNFTAVGSYGLATNRALYRALNCVDTLGIADYFDISQVLISGLMTTGNVWTAPRTYKQIGNITLPPGKWNLTYGMALVPAGGTSGDVIGLETYLSTVDSSNTGIIATTESYDYSTYTVSTGNTYPFFPQRATIDVAATTTYYLNGYVDYGAGLDAFATFGTGGEDTYMYAHRITTTYLDIAEIAKYFLQYPAAQGAETLLDASVNGNLQISANRMSSINTTNAISMTLAPVVISGGAGVGSSLFSVGNIYNNLSTSSKTISRDTRIRDLNGASPPSSGVAEGQHIYVSGEWKHTNASGAGNTVFVAKNAGLTNANVVVGHSRVVIPQTLASNSISTGALIVNGGISCQENLYASNIVATNITTNANVAVYSSAPPNTTGFTNGIILADGSYSSVFINATPIAGMNADTFTNVNGLTYIASASSIGSDAGGAYSPFKAFDGNNGTFWHCNFTVAPYDTNGNYIGNQYNTTISGVGTISGEWLQIQFPFRIIMSYYLLRARSGFQNSMPKLYYIVGSNDGSSWVQIDFKSDTNLDGSPEIFANVISTTAYSYYRLVVNKVYRIRGVADLAEWIIDGYIDSSRYNTYITNTLNETVNVGFGVNNIFGYTSYASLQTNVRTNTDTLVSLSNRTNTLFSINKVGNVRLSSTNPSTTTSTGTLIVNGGVGIGGNLCVGGNIRIYDGANNSTLDQSGGAFLLTNPTLTTPAVVLDTSATTIQGTITRVIGNVVLPNAFNTVPTDLSGLQLWFDANDYSTLVLGGTGGNELIRWNDKSGFGRIASLYDTGTTKNTYNAFIYNGLPGIQFVYNQGFSVPLPAGTLSGGATFFVVFQKNGGTTSFETLISRTVGNIPSPFDIYNQTRLLGNGTVAGGSADSSFNIATATGLNIFSSVINYATSSTASYTEWVNGASTLNTQTISNVGDNGTAIYIGTRGETNSSTKFNGVIAEILVYNRSLSTNERQIIEGYLANKWNMQGNLNASHPYKATRYISTLVSQPTINPVLNNSKLHNYIYNNANVNAPRNVVAQSCSILRASTLVNVFGGNIIFTPLELRKNTVVSGCFFYSNNAVVNCQFGIYKGGSNSTLLASTSATINIQVGVNYIPFTSSWIVPSTDIYYLGFIVPGSLGQFASLTSSSYYTYGYNTTTNGELNKACQFSNSTYSTLPASLSGVAFTYSGSLVWVGLYNGTAQYNALNYDSTLTLYAPYDNAVSGKEIWNYNRYFIDGTISNVASTSTGTGGSISVELGRVGTACLKIKNAQIFYVNPTNFNRDTMTISLWVRVENYNSFQRVYSYSSGGYWIVLQHYPEANGIAVETKVDGSIAYYGSPTNISRTNIPQNTWAHICIVANGTNMTYYVNNVQYATRTRTVFGSTGEVVHSVGSVNNSTTFDYIDDLRLYGRALTATEVDILYRYRDPLLA